MKRRPPEPMTDVERDAMAVLHQYGWTIPRIARAMRRHHQTVHKAVGDAIPTKAWAVAAYLRGVPARKIGLGGGSLYGALRKAGVEPNREIRS